MENEDEIRSRLGQRVIKIFKRFTTHEGGRKERQEGEQDDDDGEKSIHG